MAAILDTNSWSWRSPKPSHLYQPYPQSHGIISIMNETKIVYGLGKSQRVNPSFNIYTQFYIVGTNYHTLFDSLHTFDTINEIWESPQGSLIPQDGDISSVNSDGSKTNNTLLWIIVACFGFALVLSYVAALWAFGFRRIHTKFYNLFQLVKREVWKPRYTLKHFYIIKQY